MAPYLATSRELLRAAKASLWLGLSHPLYAPQACSLLPPPSVRLSLVYGGYCLPYYHIVLFHRLPCNSCSACLLPTVHLGNIASHSNRSYPLPGGSRLAASSSIFHDPPLLPRTIAYTTTEQLR